MAPIVCKVIDATSSGIPGIRATLEYKGHDGMTLRKVESVSDVNGQVRWFPLPFTKDPLLDPHTCAWVSLTFVPNDQIFPVSWLSIQADIRISPESRHAFTLHLSEGSADYRVEHASLPGPTLKEMGWTRPTLMEVDRTRPTLMEMDWTTAPTPDGISGCHPPSPSQLPLPSFYDCGAVGLKSNKRKRSSDCNERPHKKR